ncbi:kelch repeat-containing protein [Alteromonas sp. MTD1]|uniref:Kelch repeat-containing protein n=1 Tax=Alteromonas sp. MTD1 TaxID=3057962 RepID=UPI0036F407F8
MSFSRVFRRSFCQCAGVATVLLGLSFSAAGESDVPEDTRQTKQAKWENMAALPYRVQEIYPVVFRNHIVVAGGLSPDVSDRDIDVSNRVVIYNIEKNTWTEGPKLPEARHHPMLVNAGNRLFAFGGFTVDNEGIWHNSTDILELTFDCSKHNCTDNNTSNNKDSDKYKNENEENIFTHARWKKVASLPTPLSETLSSVNGNAVHLVSGRSPKSDTSNSQWIDQIDVDTHLMFNPEKMNSTDAEPVPTARNSACSVTLNDQMHTIGGRTVSGGNLASHEVYNFTTGKWQVAEPLPEAQGGLACATLNGSIYVFGGEYFDNGGGVYSKVWQYSVDSDEWYEVSTMPFPRHGLGAVTIGDSIYVIAGAMEAGGNKTTSMMSRFAVID